jgi:hypothetical protein
MSIGLSKMQTLGIPFSSLTAQCKCKNSLLATVNKSVVTGANKGKSHYM